MSQPAPRYRIESFGEAGDAPAPAAVLTALHTALLPDSPVVGLGRDFMERFYYRSLPALQLIYGAVAYVDDQPAGLIVATHDSDGFMRTALHRRWWLIAWVLGGALLRKPRRAAALWEAIRIMGNRETAARAEPIGELLSFGVLPEFRSARFVRHSGLRVGQDLMQTALDRLRAHGVQAVCALVDKDNVTVKLMYRGLGWRLTADDVPGWRTPQVEFTWRDDGGVSSTDSHAEPARE